MQARVRTIARMPATPAHSAPTDHPRSAPRTLIRRMGIAVAIAATVAASVTALRPSHDGRHSRRGAVSTSPHDPHAGKTATKHAFGKSAAATAPPHLQGLEAMKAAALRAPQHHDDTKETAMTSSIHAALADSRIRDLQQAASRQRASREARQRSPRIPLLIRAMRTVSGRRDRPVAPAAHHPTPRLRPHA